MVLIQKIPPVLANKGLIYSYYRIKRQQSAKNQDIPKRYSRKSKK
jgi:hypothetical protein